MSTTYLSRGIDHLGDLGAKLRDLQGYRTLAYELVQNADDARDTTAMSFDVSEEALIVDNDGVFSDCGNVEVADCAWREDLTHGHRCDFHRFRIIASGDKRREEGTTGAFGIGFIAVYQITDCPELISAGRHWILHEDQVEDRRIEVCAGCARCSAQELPGTRFVLPWAREPNSSLRQALRAQSVPPEGPERMRSELRRSLQIAMLFLKRLCRIQIKWSGQAEACFQRRDEGNTIILGDGDPKNDRAWHIIRGDFSRAADQLRSKHRDQIESKRSAQVALAIPLGTRGESVLCACLPTEHDVGLPFHLNADFFPSNDRKRVIFADDYQSEWNRAALKGGADTLAASLLQLPALLGAEHLCDLLSNLKKASDNAATGTNEPTLNVFWQAVAPHLKATQIICTTQEQWTTPSDAAVLLQSEEASVIPVLENLGLKIAHEKLRPYQSLLRLEAIGVRVLNIADVCEVLVSHGLNHRAVRGELPCGLNQDAGLTGLWTEIERLLQRQQRNPKALAEDERLVRGVAIAPGRDGALYPCNQIYSADGASVQLFESLNLGIPFVASEESFSGLRYLCRPFDAAAAVAVLKEADAEKFESAWQQKQLDLKPLFAWFENRRQEILADKVTKDRLGALRLYPSSSKLRTMSEVVLPGTFDDPLGLADLLDVPALGGRREFLRDVGMSELDFKTYASQRLPAALKNTGISADKRLAAVLLLAEHIGKISDDPQVPRRLADVPLVQCNDGVFRWASQCYFDGNIVREALGDGVHFATLPKEHENAVRQVYRWLGVSTEPRLSDIGAQLRELSAKPYSAAGVSRIQKLISYLGKKFDKGDDPPELRFLKNTLRWLPAKNKVDRWYQPSELYAAYQAHLFDSQALFLDVPRNIQDASSSFLQFIGVEATPPVSLVVKHLLHCAAKQQPVNVAIYQFLNIMSKDTAVNQLKGKHCLWIEGSYRAPNEVFWGAHPFGRYRWRLGDELRSYGDLLRVLQVRDAPDYQDAFLVLREIAEQFNKTNSPLDDHAFAVLMACWQIFENALTAGSVPSSKFEELHCYKCVPNTSRVLNPPDWIFFENRAGLAGKFGDFLLNNVIPRPLGAGNAFSAAGVRPLGSAVTVEILECVDPKDAPEVLDRIRTRKNEIGRVLESQASSQASLTALSTLDHIRCQVAIRLVARFRLKVFNRDLDSTPEQIPALFRPEQALLMFSLREGGPPWPAIARELSVALFPDEDPGKFAAGLKEILAAGSAAEAARVLDELGFARLDMTVQEVVSAETFGSLGEPTSPEENVVPDGAGGDATAESPDDLSPEDAIKRLLGSDAPNPSPPVPQALVGEATTGDGQNGTRGSRGAAKGKGRLVLRSYVPSPDQKVGVDEGKEGDGTVSGRSPVDIAGIARVLEYESKCGRFPTEMPHKNPGYDVESRSDSGNIMRYIEVKAFSGDWSDTYAVLSRTQFDKGSELAGSFWLYVVERADADNYEIHRIQNPPLKANHFMFDDGWRVLAEPSEDAAN
jgi:hypothetical protein